MECINFQVSLKAICEMFRASVLKEGVSAKQVAIIYSPAPKSNLNKKGFENGPYNNDPYHVGNSPIQMLHKDDLVFYQNTTKKLISPSSLVTCLLDNVFIL